jgi:ubiquinone/menaquinone biosynthesis C-methylase UbiE
MNNKEIVNRKFWDEVAPVHKKSYDIEKLRKTGCLIDNIQLGEVGNIKGRTMLHLQCHIGTDTISWANKGAIVTGIDFSFESIEIAGKLSNELGVKARFIQSNIYDLPDILNEKFDIIYTSQGVLCWLKDIKGWGKIIRKFLKDDGFFYIMEGHPFSYVFDIGKKGCLNVSNSYFNKKPTFEKIGGPDYSDPKYVVKNSTYEWQWTMGDIVNALTDAGLKLEFIHEYDRIFFKCLNDMVQDKEGWWYLPRYKGMVPLIFTLKAGF